MIILNFGKGGEEQRRSVATLHQKLRKKGSDKKPDPIKLMAPQKDKSGNHSWKKFCKFLKTN